MNIHQTLRSGGHKICYIEFIKRNGELRKMWAIPYIKQNLLVGGDKAYEPFEHRITVVRDILLSEGDCIRAIRWDAIIKLSIGKKKYVRQEDELHVV